MTGLRDRHQSWGWRDDSFVRNNSPQVYKQRGSGQSWRVLRKGVQCRSWALVKASLAQYRVFISMHRALVQSSVIQKYLWKPGTVAWVYYPSAQETEAGVQDLSQTNTRTGWRELSLQVRAC